MWDYLKFLNASRGDFPNPYTLGFIHDPTPPGLASSKNYTDFWAK